MHSKICPIYPVTQRSKGVIVTHDPGALVWLALLSPAAVNLIAGICYAFGAPGKIFRMSVVHSAALIVALRFSIQAGIDATNTVRGAFNSVMYAVDVGVCVVVFALTLIFAIKVARIFWEDNSQDDDDESEDEGGDGFGHRPRPPLPSPSGQRASPDLQTSSSYCLHRRNGLLYRFPRKGRDSVDRSAV